MPDLTTIFHHLRRQLFPPLASELGPLSALDQQFCEVISLSNLGRFTRRYDWCRTARAKVRTRCSSGFTRSRFQLLSAAISHYQELTLLWRGAATARSQARSWRRSLVREEPTGRPRRPWRSAVSKFTHFSPGAQSTAPEPRVG